MSQQLVPPDKPAALGRDFVLGPGESATKAPVRITIVQGDERPPVDAHDEPEAMTFPHLLLRELIALLSVSLFLVVLALVFNAPLEEIANPEKTPNPAKAPWYFLGLQELLHYYPPVVSGVILPGLVVLALAIIPYFRVNLERPALWISSPKKRLGALWLSVAALTVVFLFSGAHPMWPVIGPLWACAVAMSLPPIMPGSLWVQGWLGGRSLAFWIFFWFLLVAVTLTIIGMLFRGPGWQFVIPWRDGLYY